MMLCGVSVTFINPFPHHIYNSFRLCLIVLNKVYCGKGGNNRISINLGRRWDHGGRRNGVVCYVLCTPRHTTGS